MQAHFEMPEVSGFDLYKEVHTLRLISHRSTLNGGTRVTYKEIPKYGKPQKNIF